ncbi:hypothetical protein D4R52_03570 [bacterium]|nr:MAG: hypothetical protein D4R52_03570 [bacterium]
MNLSSLIWKPRLGYAKKMLKSFFFVREFSKFSSIYKSYHAESRKVKILIIAGNYSKIKPN